jgi:hypothetical protein
MQTQYINELLNIPGLHVVIPDSDGPANREAQTTLQQAASFPCGGATSQLLRRYPTGVQSSSLGDLAIKH